MSLRNLLGGAGAGMTYRIIERFRNPEAERRTTKSDDGKYITTTEHKRNSVIGGAVLGGLADLTSRLAVWGYREDAKEMWEKCTDELSKTYNKIKSGG